jgi:energy-coupling factor transporter ATP-binding protein EcfA2
VASASASRSRARLVNNPSILLADEPTGNLDSKTGAEIMSLFATSARGGNTIVLVTHEADVAAYAHRTISLRDGQIEKIVRSGSPRHSVADKNRTEASHRREMPRLETSLSGAWKSTSFGFNEIRCRLVVRVRNRNGRQECFRVACCGILKSRAVSPISTIRPRYITAVRRQICSTSADRAR